jgi:hypothetical protein
VIIFTVESPRGLTTLYTGSTEFFGTAEGLVLHPPMTKVIRRQKTKITFSLIDTACFFINIPSSADLRELASGSELLSVFKKMSPFQTESDSKLDGE